MFCPSCTPWLTGPAFSTVKANPLMQFTKDVRMVQNMVTEKVFLSSIHLNNQDMDGI